MSSYSEHDRFIPYRGRHQSDQDDTEYHGSISDQEHERASHRASMLQESSASLAGGDRDDASRSTLVVSSKDGSESTMKSYHEQYAGGTHDPSSSTRGRRRLFTAWWLEIVACIATLAGTLALFATLYTYMNRPSPNWPRWISLNTIVSIYITIVKTGIVFVLSEGIGQLKWSWFTSKSRPLHDIQTWDDATRGPVGAAVLIGSLRGRDLLASLGALLIVLVLAVDPVAQQLIHYYNCDITVPGAASIPRIRHFLQPGSQHTGALSQSIVPGVINALNGGVFSPTPNPPFECSTGNCTWPSEYSTLAWCSSCLDVSHELRIVNHTFTSNDTCENGAPYVGDCSSRYGWNYTTSIPGGISANKSYIGPWWDYGAMGPSPVHVSSADSCNGCGSSIDFLIGATPGGALNPSTNEPYPECSDVSLKDTWPCRGYGASRCEFKACIKTFNAAVRVGRLEETLVDTTNDWGINEYGGGSMLDAECLSSDELQSLRDLGYSINDTQRWVPFNDTNDPNDVTNKVNVTSLSDSMESHGCLYSFDLTWQSSIDGYMTQFLTGVVVGYIPAPEIPLGNFFGPQVVQSIFNFGNITFDTVRDSFANISTGLTNYMRLHPYPSNTPMSIGISKETKICVGIRWAWMAYPVALVVLTVIFFLLLFLETWPTRSGPKVWKSSLLALLYHGLHEPSRPECEAMDHADLVELDQMKAKAKSTSVTLSDSNDGVTYFVEHRKNGD